MSLSLQLKEHRPRKRIRSNTVAAHLDRSIPGMSKPSTSIGSKHFGKTSAHQILLVRLDTIPVGSGPTVWHLPSLLQIIPHPTPDLVN